MITTGLIIDEPWISRILAGEKSWEMRSTNVNKRGPIALIRKGSGLIVGVGNLVACSGPYDRAGMIENISKHTIPEAMITSGQVDKWCWAWELNQVRALEHPVPYNHPNGAVIWVKLDESVGKQLESSTEGLPCFEMTAKIPWPRTLDGELVREEARRSPVETLDTRSAVRRAAENTTKDELVCRVPVAKDGSRFGPQCGARGYFQVGAKGEEKKFDTYEQALAALEKMPTARWRRPNAKGNWGIVAAVRWE